MRRDRDHFPRETDGRTLPRFHRRQLAERDEQRVTRAVRDARGDDGERRSSTTEAGGDHLALRGIPVQARGVGGTSPGSNPLAELIRRESERERGGRGRAHLNQSTEHLNGR